MDDAKLHSWAARIEKQIANFRILEPSGAVVGGFDKVKAGARNIGERIANIQKALASFNITGAQGVSVVGSLEKGIAINATAAEMQSGAGSSSTGATGPPPVTGCTDPAANNYNPAATVDDGSCTYDSACFDLSYSASAPSCDGDFFVGVFTNPFARNATITISGTVDDDILVDGVVLQDGAFPFTDTSMDPCPGSGVLNGMHSISYTAMVTAHQAISVSVRNNFRGGVSLFGTVCFT